MKILKFSQFINEAETSSGGDKAVVYIGAGTTKSNITDSQAKKMGVEKDKKYKITINDIGNLMSLSSTQTLNFLAEKNRMKVEDMGKVKPGEDYLKIGDLEIKESGDIAMSKNDLGKGPIVIEAANNGILALYRISGKYNKEKGISSGIKGFKRTINWKKPFSEVNDFVINVNMGAPVSAEGRFGEWMGAWSGEGKPNSPIRNGFVDRISAVATKVSGGKVLDQNLLNAPYVKSDSDSVEEGAEWVNGYCNKMRENMLKRKFLANSKEIDFRSDIKSFLTNKENFSLSSPNPRTNVRMVKYTPKGKKELASLWKKIAGGMAKSTRPDGFSSKIDPLLPEASKILQSTFGGVYPDLAERSMVRVQRENKYGKATAKSGGAGAGSESFAEGGF